MSRNRGRRYEEPKLNMKKVFAVIIAIIVVIMFVFIIRGILVKDEDQGRISSKSYFVSFKDNKWGVIDSLGATVIDPSYEEMIVIPNAKSDVFLCIYDVNYETGEYKTKALNSKNETILTGYEQIEGVQNQDSNNNLWYEENVLKVKKDGKYGLIGLDGKELVACQYDAIESLRGIRKTFIVEKDGKYGAVDETGKELVKVEYSEIQTLGTDNKTGFIVKNEAGKAGIVDNAGNVIIAAEYDDVRKVYANDYYVVRNGTQDILLKKDGTEALKEGFNEIKGILKTPDTGIIYVKDGTYGVMNLQGETLIKESYEELTEAKAGIFIAKKSRKIWSN